MSRAIHVSKQGSDNNNGTKEAPYLTINKAAQEAKAGDTVIVHEGVYRESVSPKNGGTETARIVYKSAEGEKALIKGSERIEEWRKEGELYKASIDNEIFGEYNPYTTAVDGDWLMRPIDKFVHTGMVYINGEPLIEVTEKSELKENTWYTEQAENKTIIYANFGEADPKKCEIEINVRRSCFAPEKTGVNYISVEGFEMAQAATPWSPPTAEQPGLLWTNWSKGWVIENNKIHDSRCCGISVGKEISTGHNPYTKYHRKSGYQYQLETVFRAVKAGWTKETIGSHIIRNNEIYNCGQNGIVGHMGGAFSDIYNNHIHHIGDRQEFYGYEIAGIKLHAAIDTQIHDNVIHDCYWGLWLDWQAQGVRVSRNVFYDNIDKDMWLEVTHGPFMIDNNICTSKRSMTNNAQGGAYINNIFGGGVRYYGVLNRSTPYHYAHTTEIAGCALVYGGDNRYYNNIYCGEGDEVWLTGLHYFDEHTTSLEEYIERVMKKGRGDIEKFEDEKQPVYINRNCYLDGVKGFAKEETKIESAHRANLKVEEENGELWLSISLPKEYEEMECPVIRSFELPVPRICEQRYEAPDGSEITADTDVSGQTHVGRAGAVSGLKAGENRIKLRSI